MNTSSFILFAIGFFVIGGSVSTLFCDYDHKQDEKALQESFDKGTVLGVQKTIQKLAEDKLFLYKGEIPAGCYDGCLFIKVEKPDSIVTIAGEGSLITNCSMIGASTNTDVYENTSYFLLEDVIGHELTNYKREKGIK